MIKKFFTILFLSIILLHPKLIHANNHKYIEIFDPQQNKVVKTVEMNEEINNMIKTWICEIEYVYPDINPIQDSGYAVKFPLESAIQVKNKWLNTNIKELYLTIPEIGKPCLILFGTGPKPNFFLFPGDTNELSKILNFQLE